MVLEPRSIDSWIIQQQRAHMQQQEAHLQVQLPQTRPMAKQQTQQPPVEQLSLIGFDDIEMTTGGRGQMSQLVVEDQNRRVSEERRYGKCRA